MMVYRLGIFSVCAVNVVFLRFVIEWFLYSGRSYVSV
jgi:hypothetical protein